MSNVKCQGGFKNFFEDTVCASLGGDQETQQGDFYAPGDTRIPHSIFGGVITRNGKTAVKKKKKKKKKNDCKGEKDCEDVETNLDNNSKNSK